MQERTALEDQLTSIGRIERELDDQITMIELGEAEKDQAVVNDAEAALKRLKADVARREMEALLSGEADYNDSYLEVHAGAGGTESQDWANMLLRMYTRWAEQHGYKVEYPRGDRRRRGRHQVGDHRDQGPQRLWLAQDRGRRAPAGAHLAVRFQCAAAHVVRERDRLSGDRRPHQGRHQGIRRARRHDARPGRRRPARQQDRVRDPADPYPDQHRGLLPAGPLAAPQPRARRGRCCARASTKRN